MRQNARSTPGRDGARTVWAPIIGLAAPPFAFAAYSELEPNQIDLISDDAVSVQQPRSHCLTGPRTLAGSPIAAPTQMVRRLPG
jgi:hypothetical protein